MNATAEAKIQMLRSSIQCFVCGLLGLLPAIGLPFALAALVISAKVRARQKQNWNAAQPYQVWGVVCAAAGTIFWGFILTIIIYRTVNPY
ncbi:MAG: hypothetical protein WBN75_06740 [Verrucomicrobiia bacterium]|jgi:hypothetical protein